MTAQIYATLILNHSDWLLNCLNESECFKIVKFLWSRIGYKFDQWVESKDPEECHYFCKTKPNLFLKMGQTRPLFCVLLSFFTGKTVDVSEIRTQIVGKQGEHADRLTTTTAKGSQIFDETSLANFSDKLCCSNCLGPFFKAVIT